ncbi:MAG: imidazoleglycerol-phosphate dehydratase, partial [Sulfurimonas sp.]|nr:imidazoleglycerol-phosphate dehydratase [Sulfurimonas sp.]
MITKTRKTKETDITISLDIMGSGVSHINSGVGFLDHMLE